ncbi:MAG TPA: hypothetical protein VM933_04410 [Acidimicrobiales bacterium]|nr:hypothetical protein [Acidimicrobiales bacterium]
MKARPAPLLLAAVTLLGACGSDRDPVVGAGPGGNATTTAAAADDTGEAPTATTSGASGFATTTVSTPTAARGLLEAVTATHDADGGLDRLVFTFEGDVPGYRVGYVERPIVQDGSGDEVVVDGAAVLGVHFEPASGFDLTGEGRQVYRGPTRLDLATRAVLDVVRVSDFEANLDWAVGVDAPRTPFRVRTDGRSVVVEVQVPSS